MQACSQGIIVSKDQFKKIASKEIYVLLHLVLMLCRILNGVIRAVFYPYAFYPVLFQESIQYVPHLFHLYVAINKDLSQPLRAKGVRIGETKHDLNNPVT